MSLPMRLKRRLRPLAFALRRARQAAGRALRPPIAWDGRHHPVLDRFPPWSGEADGRFFLDSLGIRTDPRFRAQIRPQPAGPLSTEHPPPHAGYFELTFVLESVLAAERRGRMVVMELGAGYGPWLVTAHRAARLRSDLPVELIGVEMVPHHFEYLQQHLRNNGIDPQQHTLIHAAVSDVGGVAWYQPESDARLDYGQRMLRRDGAGRRETARPPAPATLAPIRVPCLPLAELLARHERIDLLHVDVQGEELRALTGAGAELERRVDRLLVATHSSRIHRRLRARLGTAGWTLVHDYRCRARERTPFGDVQFLDGLIAAVRSGR